MRRQLPSALLVSLAFTALAAPTPQNTSTDRVTTALSQKQFRAALDLAEVALKEQPASVQLWTLKALAHGALGSKVEALSAFRTALSIQPAYVPALRGAAEIEYSSRDPRARQTLEAIVKLSPENAVAHAMLGVLAFEADDCESAVSHFGKGGSQVARQKTALSLFGSCLLRLNRAQEAADVFKSVLDLDLNDPKTRLHVALAASALGKPKEAIAVLQPVARSSSPDADVLGVLAESYRADNQVQEAIATYRQAIELYPKEERLYLGLIALCQYYNSHELGFEVVDVGLKNVPSSARLHAMRGILFFQTGQPEKAVSDFERASEVAPSDALGQTGLALTRLQEGYVDEAIQIARDQLRNTPEDAAAAFILAQALTKKASGASDKHFAEAQATLEKSVQIAPQFAPARALLGKLYLQGNQVDRAVEQLEAAINLEPGNRAASYQLMIAYKRLGRSSDVQAMQDKIRTSVEHERREDERRSSIRLLKDSRSR